MAVLVQPRLSITFIGSKEGWCGESHTLPYPGYATAIDIVSRVVLPTVIDHDLSSKKGFH